MLRPFFHYYGSKFNLAIRYPKPEHNVVVEAFAGSAGYSVRYAVKHSILFDADPIIIGVWNYLINADTKRILSLPDIKECVDEVPDLVEAERHLIGFWLNASVVSPCKRPSSWMRGGLKPNAFWGPYIRQRIANQLDAIRGWKAINIDCLSVGNEDTHTPATWFVDPPYMDGGSHYRYNNVDYKKLATWCNTRCGLVIVCERGLANWLPFTPIGYFKSTARQGRISDKPECVLINRQ